ncbi:WGxxGxxG family protein [Spirillospora sp. NPDC029432]|uniref:WGxxGxxG family protein n=1 Tax=Spirillospora sp. NPDC029432 TaxID=3154599 RepID=UPI003451F8BD
MRKFLVATGMGLFVLFGPTAGAMAEPAQPGAVVADQAQQQKTPENNNDDSGGGNGGLWGLAGLLGLLGLMGMKRKQHSDTGVSERPTVHGR